MGYRGGLVVGDAREVRIFDVRHIKGMEFEAVFVGIDRLAERIPDLFLRFLYVGVTRAATYLGLTCETDLPKHFEPVRWMGLVQNFTNRASEAIAEFERALALDRNSALAHGGMGFAKMALGRSEETEVHIEQALRLSPQDPIAYIWAAFAGMAKLQLGRDEEAAAWLRRSIEFNRNYSTAHFFLAASLAQRGKLDEARTVAAVGLTLDPTFTIHRFRGTASSDNPVYLAGRERAIEGMRKAGVPEG
jgi:tetratricopeptide (TPR) repeat protein